MKMLMIGDLNETLNSLSEFLMQDFQIQMCSENADNVKDMLRIYKPAIVVYIVSELTDEAKSVFAVLEDKYSIMPIVVLCNKEIRMATMDLMEKFNNKMLLCRPVVSSDVRRECFLLLNKKVRDNEEETVEKKKILVVDDNALFLRNVKSLLEDEYQISLANSGQKAIEFLNREKVDLVLLDYAMPTMNGREVFERMIANESTKDIPVVFLTSVAERDQIYAVLKNIPAGYILKPPANEKILSTIKEALK